MRSELVRRSPRRVIGPVPFPAKSLSRSTGAADTAPKASRGHWVTRRRSTVSPGRLTIWSLSPGLSVALAQVTSLPA